MIVGLAYKKTDVATDTKSWGTKQVQFKSEMFEWNKMLWNQKKKKDEGNTQEQNNPY